MPNAGSLEWGRYAMRIFCAFACMLFAAFAVFGASASAASARMELFDGKTVASIVYDGQGGTPIRKAAQLLSHDLSHLTGRTPVTARKQSGLSGNGIIIGLAASPEIAALLKKNGISAKPIEGKWETYGRAVVPAPWDASKKALVIFGSDTRGTIWGVIDLTREMGVSAWQWWADVKIRKVSRISVDAALHYSKEPTVKYRGFFINADGLNKWAKRFDPKQGGIGPKTYDRVFQLMWRLKANVLWPAMGGTDIVFNEVPANYDLARDYAIIRGSSHVEMLLRNNSHEWNAKTMGPYNWLVNRKRMIAYWKTAVEKWGKYDNMYTIGLRGADDFPMEGVNTPEKMADVITDVIKAQRKILTDVLHKPADQIPQIFTPYKEITAAYDTGRLKLPADVILDWSEDNFGYAMQLSNAQERKRPGGSGMYYHLIFWGRPAGYIWLASTDPSLMWEEMMKAYHFGTRAFWILNVGSIKPCEFLMQFYLDMAFNADAFKNPSSVHAYLRDWVGHNFGAAHRDAITEIMWRYYKLAFDRNPEFMAWTTTFPETAVGQTEFNMLDYGDENARRADAYKSIMADAAALMDEMPADRKAAFYELVQYPVNTAGNLNLVQLNLDKSITYGLQHRASANVYAEKSNDAYHRILADTQHYNDEDNGKWRGIVTAHPHALPNYQAPYVPDWKVPAGEHRCGVQVEGGGYFNDDGWWFPTLPLFHRELGARRYYIDVFEQQPGKADWSAHPNAPWIKVDRLSGHFSPAARNFQQRLQVSVDWTKAPKTGEGTVTIQCSAAKQPVDVHVRIAPPENGKAASFIESQGVVSMYAKHADETIGPWHVLQGLGHTGADLQTDLDMRPVNANDPASLKNAPRLVYRFVTQAPDRNYSFPTNIYDETAIIKAFALPTFPFTPKGHVRIAMALDGGAPKVIDLSPEEFSAQWRKNDLRNAAVAKIIGQHIKPGSHTLTVYALDPGVTLDRFEIDFTGSSPAYGPIPETRIEH